MTAPVISLGLPMGEQGGGEFYCRGIAFVPPSLLLCDCRIRRRRSRYSFIAVYTRHPNRPPRATDLVEHPDCGAVWTQASASGRRLR